MLSLAWPIVVARATQSVIGFCDALMVAPLGKDSLAAGTTGALNTFVIVMLPMGVAFIVQSFASQLKGRGDLVRARRYAWYGLMIAAAAAVLSLAAMPFIKPVLGLLGFAPVVRDLQAEYLLVRLTSVAAIVGTEAIGNWFSGLGRTGQQMRAGLIAMATNVPLNWLLIEGHAGFPRLGVAGAALASSIASWVGFAYMVIEFRRNGDGRVTGGLGLRKSELWGVVRFGLPNGINWFFEFAAFSFFINSVMTHLGTVSLAAMNVVFSINGVAFMPGFGLASAGAILVGQRVGAGDRDHVGGILALTAKVTAVWMGGVGLSYLIAPTAIFSLFTSASDPQGPALLATGATLLALSTSWQLFDAMGLTLSESLRATGDTVWCLRARLVIAWGLFVPMSWLLVIRLGMGIGAAIGCLVGYLVLLVGAFYWRFRSGAWKKIQMVEELPEKALG